jgi:hypothetical protein
MSAVLTGLCLPAEGQEAEAIEAYMSGNYPAALARTQMRRMLIPGPSRRGSCWPRRFSQNGQPPPHCCRMPWPRPTRLSSLQPGHIEARLQKAIALSLLSRPMSAGECGAAALAAKRGTLLKAYWRKNPATFMRMPFLAVWNAEVIRRGGTLGAMMMGASLDKARQSLSGGRGACARRRGDPLAMGSRVGGTECEKVHAEIE